MFSQTAGNEIKKELKKWQNKQKNVWEKKV